MFLLSPWPIDASGVQRKAAAPKIAFGHLAIFAHFRRFLLCRSMTCRSENKVSGNKSLNSFIGRSTHVTKLALLFSKSKYDDCVQAAPPFLDFFTIILRATCSGQDLHRDI